MTSSGNNKKSWIESMTVIAALLGAIAALLTALLGGDGIKGLLKGENPEKTKNSQGTNASPTPSSINVSPIPRNESSSARTGDVNVNSTSNSEGGSARTGDVNVNSTSNSEGGRGSVNEGEPPNTTSFEELAKTAERIAERQRPRVNIPRSSDPPSAPSPTTQSPDITRSEYDAIQNGMTYEQVAQIIGSPGESGGFNGPFSSYKWDDGGPFGVRLTFLDGRLTSKSSYGHGSNLKGQ